MTCAWWLPLSPLGDELDRHQRGCYGLFPRVECSHMTGPGGTHNRRVEGGGTGQHTPLNTCADTVLHGGRNLPQTLSVRWGLGRVSGSPLPGPKLSARLRKVFLAESFREKKTMFHFTF